MESNPDVNQDLLGLQRFALTESAYDLVNSLVGIYSRLITKATEQPVPDANLLMEWRTRVLDLNSIYYKEDWTNLLYVENLISELSTEYKQAAKQEAAWISNGNYGPHANSRTVSAV